MAKKTIKIKRINLPLKKMSEKEKDYVAVVLEDVNHNFRAFGEVLASVRERGDATFEEVGRINEKLISMDLRLESIEKEVVLIKNEIKDLKLSLTKKADVEKLKELEFRIGKIEQHLKLSMV